MQVNSSVNNVNFCANRIASVTRFVENARKYEKHEIYRLNSKDIPFIKKIVSFMDSQKKKLDESQERMLKSLKEFIQNHYKYMETHSGKYDRLYIGIKDDEQITGTLSTTGKLVYGGTYHSIREYCPVANDGVLEDSFIFSLIQDKTFGKDFISDYGSKIKFNKFSRNTARKKIRECNPDYNFQLTRQDEKFNLEEVLGINEGQSLI